MQGGGRKVGRPRVARAGRRAVMAAWLVSVVVLSGCGVRLQANHLVVRIDGTGMRLAQVNGSATGVHAPLPSGETVIDVINADPSRAHTISLVKGVATPAALPQRVRTARLVSDDPDEILDMSESLDRDQVTVSATGGIIDDPKKAQFHEYLAPGQAYLLVDVARASSCWLALAPSGTA